MSFADEFKTAVYTSTVAGSISCLCSGLLLFCIFFLSEVKWRSPVRRIIIGFCIHDIFFSLSSVIAGFAVPKGQGLLASGNQTTCDMQGFMMHVGMIGSMFYNCFLSVYFVALITFSMKRRDFRRKIECWIHLVINLFAIGTAIFLLVKKSFNVRVYGNMCYISASPVQCLSDKNVVCDRGSLQTTTTYTRILAVYPFFLSFLIISISMMVLIRTVVLNRIRSDRWRVTDSSNRNRNCLLRVVFAICRFTSKKLISKTQRSQFSTIRLSSDPSTQDSNLEQTQKRRNSAVSRSGTPDDPYAFDIKKVMARIQEETGSSAISKNFSERKNTKCPVSSPQTDSFIKNGVSPVHDSDFIVMMNDTKAQREKKDTSSIEDQVVVQALLYMASFFICYIFVAVTAIIEVRKAKIPFGLRVVNRLTFPLQGFFFILVYLRPRVNKIRKNKPTYSYLKAFMMAVKSGGDNDKNDSKTGLSRKTRKKRQKSVYDDYERRRSSQGGTSLIMNAQKARVLFENIQDDYERRNSSNGRTSIMMCTQNVRELHENIEDENINHEIEEVKKEHDFESQEKITTSHSDEAKCLAELEYMSNVEENCWSNEEHIEN